MLRFFGVLASSRLYYFIAEKCNLSFTRWVQQQLSNELSCLTHSLYSGQHLSKEKLSAGIVNILQAYFFQDLVNQFHHFHTTSSRRV